MPSQKIQPTNFPNKQGHSPYKYRNRSLHKKPRPKKLRICVNTIFSNYAKSNKRTQTEKKTIETTIQLLTYYRIQYFRSTNNSTNKHNYRQLLEMLEKT